MQINTGSLLSRGTSHGVLWMAEMELEPLNQRATSSKLLGPGLGNLTNWRSIVLLDMSMPELDGKSPARIHFLADNICLSGVGATKEIRDIESRTPDTPGTRILALTGMSTLEDKRRAFEAGVDG